MPSGVVAASALIFGMLSLRLMMAVEKAQVIVAGTIGQGVRSNRITAMAIGTRRLFAMRFAIGFFSRLSNLMFLVEGMYQERVVQKAMASMMNTVVTSTKVRVAAHRTKHAARHVARHAGKRLHVRSEPRRETSRSPIPY
jgi:hypothetical protein